MALSTMCTFSYIIPIHVDIIAGIFSITLVIALTVATGSPRNVAPVTSSIRMSIFGVCTTSGATICTAPTTMPPIWWFPLWVTTMQGVGAFPSKVAFPEHSKQVRGTGSGASYWHSPVLGAAVHRM